MLFFLIIILMTNLKKVQKKRNLILQQKVLDKCSKLQTTNIKQIKSMLRIYVMNLYLMLLKVKQS